jgi:NAD(P)-dependent dehydrogenase (short-subunit alcohol dehydrogenase family)
LAQALFLEIHHWLTNVSMSEALVSACLAFAFLLSSGCASHEPSLAVSATCSSTSTAADVARGINLTGKVVIVTGGDGGLGLPAVEAFAEQGATIVIASRNLSKCLEIAREVRSKTGSNVEGMELDLSELDSVRAFVKQFFSFSPRLDVLINNAGIAGNSQHTSKDGFQMVFAINYLGPFLLTELLLPALRSSGSAKSPSRIVNVASSEHAIACEAAGWEEGCFKSFRYFPPPVMPDRNVTIHYDDGFVVTRSVELYGFTKLLSIEHVLELARREGSNVKAFSLTPGWVNTSLASPHETSPEQAKEKCKLQKPDPCPYSSEEGAAIIAFCALRSTVSGGYYSRIKRCQEDLVETNRSGFREPMGSELYNRSLDLVGLLAAAERVLV